MSCIATLILCELTSIRALGKSIRAVCLDLFWPDAQVEVEACLQQQVLHVVWVDGEVEVQRVSQQLIRFFIALPLKETAECR